MKWHLIISRKQYAAYCLKTRSKIVLNVQIFFKTIFWEKAEYKVFHVSIQTSVFFEKFQIYERYFELSKARFLFLCYSTNVCRDLRDCPAGRESRSVPTLFVSRGTGTGTEVCGTSGTGTNFRGTVPHGCPAGLAGPGQKFAGLSRPVPCPSLLITVPLKMSLSNQPHNSVWKMKIFNLVMK